MKKNDLAMVASILTFWFEETTQKQKYSKDDVFDVRIRETYEETYWKIGVYRKLLTTLPTL